MTVNEKTVDLDFERKARAIQDQVFLGQTVFLRDKRDGNKIAFFNFNNVREIRPTLAGQGENPCEAIIKNADKPGEFECPGFAIESEKVKVSAPAADVEPPAVPDEVAAVSEADIEVAADAQGDDIADAVADDTADGVEGPSDDDGSGDVDGVDAAKPPAGPPLNGKEISIPDKDLPCFKVFEKWTYVAEYQKWYPGGVHHFGTETKGDKTFYTHAYICSPLHIVAIAATDQDGNFGRLLRFKNSKNNWRELAMSMGALGGSGENLRAELLERGVIINHDARHRLFPKYLLETKPTRIVKCATQVGWSGSSFVLPGKVIGPHAINVIFQSGEQSQAEYGQRGTLDGWREHVAAPAIGNPVLIAAISAAFAGPLLEKAQGESGGFHLVANSSSGKTTALRAAASVWGGPRHTRSWNATSNGMESVAALYNDSLLPIDEASEGSARDIERIIYGLGNGVGKQRANRSGGAKGVTHFKCFVVSTGEKMISTELENAGLLSKAGGEIRLLDIPVARAHGCFDDLHDAGSGADFANAIKDAVARHHGKAGPAFLERLTRDTRNWSEHFEALKRLPAFAVDGDAGQDKRAVARFALLGMAGEIASEYQITGWPAGIAIKASAILFGLWKAQRKSGTQEPVKVLEQVAAFIDRHGDSRFSFNGRNETTPVVYERAGWWEYDPDGERVYWFTKDGIREAIKGHDFDRSLDHLIAAGALPPRKGESAVPSRAKNIHDEIKTKRLYPVTYGRLLG